MKKNGTKKLKRSSGVLLNVSSLPSPFGIGTLGKSAYEFVDFLKECGFTYWQILPLNPIGAGNSPYSSASAFAGNVLYVDPQTLFDEGYISKSTLDESVYTSTPYTADYAFAIEKREKALKEAYLKVKGKDIKGMCQDAGLPDEIYDYALYRAIKSANGEKSWTEWEADSYDDETLEITLFSQYLFFEQWFKLKKYANENGIKIVGDMPIYVSMDSSDVWKHKEMFLLDKNNKPEKVAGVPPDYFSKDGQLWGNPLYDWKKQKASGYEWWCKRICFALKLYDVLRIDHFRGLASYWAIPGNAKSAKEGKWEKGPGMKLFNALSASIGSDKLSLIAEDLGVFGEDVVKLLNDSGLPGMRVIQFGFAPDEDSTHLPHNYTPNTVAYTGTHDNNTLLGFLWEADQQTRDFALSYCSGEGVNWQEGGYNAPGCRKIIEAVWRSSAFLTIAPFQDLCGFGSDARMNVPGVPEQNWRFRTTKETIDSCDKEYFKKLNKIYKRS